MRAQAIQRKIEPRDEEKWSSPISPKTLDPACLRPLLPLRISQPATISQEIHLAA